MRPNSVMLNVPMERIRQNVSSIDLSKEWGNDKRGGVKLVNTFERIKNGWVDEKGKHYSDESMAKKISKASENHPKYHILFHDNKGYVLKQMPFEPMHGYKIKFPKRKNNVEQLENSVRNMF